MHRRRLQLIRSRGKQQGQLTSSSGVKLSGTVSCLMLLQVNTQGTTHCVVTVIMMAVVLLADMLKRCRLMPDPGPW